MELKPYHPRLRDLPDDFPFRLGPEHPQPMRQRRHSVVVSAFERDVWTLDLPSLIRAKRAAGREKDLRLLPELESLSDATRRDY